MAVKYSGWIGNPDGGGLAVDFDGNITRFDKKPPDSDFGPAPKGHVRKPRKPEGDFIQSPTGEFLEIGKAGARTSRTEFIGETDDRRFQNERIMAAQFAARMGAKQKIDQQELKMGYSPAQERERSALRDVRSKLEKDFANKELTPIQLKQMQEQVTQKEQAILPQMMRKPPTSQEQYQQKEFVSERTGMRMYMTNAGKIELSPDQPTFKERSAVASEVVKMLSVPIQNSEGKTIGHHVPTPEEINAGIAAILFPIMKAGGDIGGAQQQMQQNVRPPAELREAPGQPAAEVPAEIAPAANLAERVRQGIEELKQSSTGARRQEIIDLGQTIIGEAVQSGMPPEQAVDEFIELWKQNSKKSGKLRISRKTFVAKPKDSDRKKLLDIAQIIRLEFLRAKARQ